MVCIGFYGKSQQITSLEQFKSIDGVRTMGVTKVVPPGFVPGDFTATSMIIEAAAAKKSTGTKCSKKTKGCLCVTIEVDLDGTDLRVVTPNPNGQSCEAQDAFVVPAGSILVYDPVADELSFIPR